MFHSTIKKLCWVGLFLLPILQAKAQSAYYEFLGTVILEDNTMSTYKVVFTESNGIINGYSLEDIGGKNETKAKIVGTYRSKDGYIEFKEKDILYTHYKNDKANMCMATVTGKLRLQKKSSTIDAHFTGSFLVSKKPCGKGRIILMSSKDVYEKLAGLSKALDKVKTKDSALTILKENIRAVKDLKDVMDVNANDLVSIPWQSKTVHIECWDDGIEDDDQISIKINDSLVRRGMVITRAKKEINIPRGNGGSSTLEIIADNEGNYTPNTVKVVLVDGEKRYLLLTRLKKGEHFQVQIKNP